MYGFQFGFCFRDTLSHTHILLQVLRENDKHEPGQVEARDEMPTAPIALTNNNYLTGYISNLNYSIDLGVKDNFWFCSVLAQTEALIPNLHAWLDL